MRISTCEADTLFQQKVCLFGVVLGAGGDKEAHCPLGTVATPSPRLAPSSWVGGLLARLGKGGLGGEVAGGRGVITENPGSGVML